MAFIFCTAVDEPAGVILSAKVRACIGLAPSRNQSGIGSPRVALPGPAPRSSTSAVPRCDGNDASRAHDRTAQVTGRRAGNRHGAPHRRDPAADAGRRCRSCRSTAATPARRAHRSCIAPASYCRPKRRPRAAEAVGKSGRNRRENHTLPAGVACTRRLDRVGLRSNSGPSQAAGASSRMRSRFSIP